jgi:hypothetical protein
LAPLSPEERIQVIRNSVLFGHYEKMVDRESAYERLKVKAEQQKIEEAKAPARSGRAERSPTTDLISAAAKSAAHAVGSQIGRQIIRGVLGSLFGGGRRR